MRRALLIAATALACIGVLLLNRLRYHPRLPRNLAPDIPEDCGQIMLVLSPTVSSRHAQLWLLERSRLGAWLAHRGPMPATLGGNGLGWGVGLHRSPPPHGFPVKLEGDRRSPAGIFRIPFAFGLPPFDLAAHLQLPYTPITDHTIGVDDITSRHYNRIVDDREVMRDWTGHEAMSRHTKLYEWGAFIAHNPDCIPGLGSCIFLHLTPAKNAPTAGCTALNAADLQTVLRWLDAEKNPLLVQGIENW